MSPVPPTQNTDSTVKFTDINENDWFYDDVKFVLEKGLFYGVSETIFAHQAKMTRAMIITVLARYAGVDTSGGEQLWSKAVEWGVKNNITDGTNLEDNVTREQLVVLLWRYAGSPAGAADLSAFNDRSNISDWAYDAMKWAVDKGLIRGYSDNTINPKGSATRAEVASIIRRFVEAAQ